jgi:hypothetical protein
MDNLNINDNAIVNAMANANANANANENMNIDNIIDNIFTANHNIYVNQTQIQNISNENQQLNNTIERNKKMMNRMRKIKKINVMDANEIDTNAMDANVMDANANANAIDTNEIVGEKGDNDNAIEKENKKQKDKANVRNARDKTNTREKEIFVIPTKETFSTSNNYTISQLKDIAKHYKQKISGNKKELVERIANYFKQSECIYVIQRFCKRFLYKKYKILHGPARVKRELCVNETDFYTMEPIKDIQYNQFFSFKDKDGTIYGFDILSLYTLLTGESSTVKNPYNRKPLPSSLMRDIKNIFHLSKILNFNVTIKCEDEVKTIVCPKKELETLCISLFQHIDHLGNYTDRNWFWSLDSRQLVRFLHELNDIWTYRAQLTNEMKRDICPPIGNPFMNVPINMISYQLPLFELKRISLNVIEQMVKRGVSESNRSLGANYVLCALTLVNYQAAIAMPWLYQSVAH